MVIIFAHVSREQAYRANRPALGKRELIHAFRRQLLVCNRSISAGKLLHLASRNGW